MQATDRPSPDAPSLTQAIIVPQLVYFKEDCSKDMLIDQGYGPMVQDTIADHIFDRPPFFSCHRTQSCLTSMKSSSHALSDAGTLLIASGSEFKKTQTKS